MTRFVLTAAVQVICILVAALPSWAKTVEYNLTIAQEQVNITGTPVQGMTINGTIPGPTLRFREGDRARIHVKNTMTVETSIHWHGLLVPPGMDGVPFVSFPPIAPGATFTYEFTLRQSGTYWYHSHTSLQEQRGVYGGIAIDPRGGKLRRSGDHVVVLSDWTDDDPHAVLRTLRRGSEWYAIEKGSGQSIIGAARIGMLGDYFSRELQRMPPMDIADVAYDRFLANGTSELTIPAAPGETVRLRIIDGSATTFFHLTYAGGPLTIVSADGQDVRPVKIERLLIGVAETYDVLVTVPRSGAFELRATAHDASAFASIWIGSGKRRAAPAMPKPNLYQTMGGLTMKRLFALTPAGTMGMSDGTVEAGTLDKPGMMPMHGMDHGKDSKSMDHSGHTMDHGSMKDMDHKGQTMDHGSMKGMDHGKDMKGMEHRMTMAGQEAVDRNGRRFGTRFGLLASDVSSSMDLAADGMDPRRPGPPYDKLRALRSTALPRGKSVREIRLTLDGDMERYIWLLNNKALSETDSILIKKGEVVRFIMINRTMMHHPMHLHGHFFRVINGQGNHAPLKHTVDVEPMSTTVIEFYANEFGDWFFHCHLLYHMKAGMAGLVHYDGYNLYPELAKVRPRLYKESWYVWGETTALSSMAEASITLSDTRNIISLMGEAGWEEVDRNEWEALLTWDRYVNRFFTYFIGVDVFGERSETEDTRGVLGFTYLLPLNIETRIWADDDGGWRGALHKVFDLTPRLALYGEYEYDSHEKSEARAGLAYTVSRNTSIVGQWHSDFAWGGGLQIRF